MRKLGLIAAASLMALFVVDANAADDGGRVYYKDGTRLEFKDFDMKINVHMQPRFSHEDFDGSGRTDIGLDNVGDTTGFDIERARVYFSGNLLNKQFSYQLSNDFRSDGGGSDLKDAWIQLNNDTANVRIGQFKVPFSRQEQVSDAKLMFIDRSSISDAFSPSRQMGAMLHGAVAEGLNYSVGSWNGESTGEGRNRGPSDNNLAIDAALSYASADYGTRGVEGDFRDDNSALGFTAGTAVIFEQGTGDPLDGGADSDFDRFDLNVDAGLRVAGFDLQSEIYYSTISLDGIDGDLGEGDIWGLYAQVGYNLDKEWGLGVRFGHFEPDSDLSDIKDQEEFNFVVNYYLNGHDLKLQNGVTWEMTNFDSDDVTDFRYEMQLNGYF